MVEAKVTLINKEIVTIDNCYNLTIKYDLVKGNSTPITFIGCKDIGSSTWFCDCKNNWNEYNLTMQTDGTPLKKPREYNMVLNAYIYDITKSRDTFTVKDYGYDSDIDGFELDDLGKDIQYIEVPIYINQTIYKDRIVNNSQEVVKTVYREDVQKVSQLNLQINELNKTNIDLNSDVKHYKVRIRWLYIIIGIYLLLTIFVLLKLIASRPQ